MAASGPAAKLRSKLSLGKTTDKASAVRLELSSGCSSWFPAFFEWLGSEVGFPYRLLLEEPIFMCFSTASKLGAGLKQTLASSRILWVTRQQGESHRIRPHPPHQH